MRLMEALGCRVKDMEFERMEIVVREGKGAKDRVTMLPVSAVDALKLHLKKVKALHESDLAEGYGKVYLPFCAGEEVPECRAKWG